jgi:hypothetical protein
MKNKRVQASKRGVRRVAGRSKRTHKAKIQTQTSDENKAIQNLNVNVNAADYFTTNASFDQHYDAQVENKDKYQATIMALDEYSIEMQANAKARALAAAFARNDKPLIEFLMNNEKQIGFSDLLKALTILDSQREKRSKEKKIAINAKTATVMKNRKLSKIKLDIGNLEKMKPKAGSVSGALAKKIRNHVRKFKESELEFFALAMPTEPWKKLANIVHLNPERDFPNAKWFLPYCFGQELPADSKIAKCKSINKDNVNELIEQFDLPYSVVKPFKDSLNEKSKEKIAQNQQSLDTIIWYYEDLACKAVDDIIKSRLEAGEKLELGYGKLMERLLMFKDLHDSKSRKETNRRSIDSWSDVASVDSWEVISSDNSLFSLVIPIAEARLKVFKSSLHAPVAVIGDASGSMSVAIRTATIISSLLTAICSAKLSFFNTKDFDAKMNPSLITDVLKVAYTTRADGGTAPAASLVPYFDKKEVVKTFIIVTDEEENTDAYTADKRRWRFFDLFMEYRKLVYPATLIFVSFLSHQHSSGQMYSRFVKEKVDDVLQFKFDGRRPDLTKLDSILGSLCSKDSKSFSGYVETIESELKSKNLTETLDNLKLVSSMLPVEDWVVE